MEEIDDSEGLDVMRAPERDIASDDFIDSCIAATREAAICGKSPELRSWIATSNPKIFEISMKGPPGERASDVLMSSSHEASEASGRQKNVAPKRGAVRMRPPEP